MRRVKKSSFSLIEILITCGLIAIALGAVSMQIPRAIKKARFEKGVEAIIAQATLAQELMLHHHMDVILVLDQKELLSIQIRPQKPMDKKKEQLFSKIVKIKDIKEVSFNEKKEEKIELVFEAGPLAKTPKGVLKLNHKELSASILFKGYPSRIQKGNQLEDEETPPYPEEILSST